MFEVNSDSLEVKTNQNSVVRDNVVHDVVALYNVAALHYLSSRQHSLYDQC